MVSHEGADMHCSCKKARRLKLVNQFGLMKNKEQKQHNQKEQIKLNFPQYSDSYKSELICGLKLKSKK
jgi:hypothetical protein